MCLPRVCCALCYLLELLLQCFVLFTSLLQFFAQRIGLLCIYAQGRGRRAHVPPEWHSCHGVAAATRHRLLLFVGNVKRECFGDLARALRAARKECVCVPTAS